MEQFPQLNLSNVESTIVVHTNKGDIELVLFE